MADKTPRRRRDDIPEEGDVVYDDEITRKRDDNPSERADSGNRDYREQVYEGDGKSSNWLWVILILIVIVLLAGWYFVSRYGNDININNTNQNFQNQDQENEDQKFESEQKTSNFLRSIPTQGEIIPAPPVAILIQTSTTSTAQNSSITVNKDNRDYGVGDTVVGTNGNTLRRNMNSGAPEGLYTVNYKTCESSSQCQNGRYQFIIDREQRDNYEDQRNKSEVTIVLANNRLYPERVVVSKNTKVIMVNETTSQAVLAPGTTGTRNYFANLSGNIAPNGNFTYTFAQEGYFPFNVTVNNSTVEGRLVVQ